MVRKEIRIMENRIANTEKDFIGTRLKTTRKSLKLTQKDVSRDLGVPQSNVSLYETGEYAPSLNYLMAFSRKYDISIDYILGLSDNEKTYDIRDLMKNGDLVVIESEENVTIEIISDNIKELISERK